MSSSNRVENGETNIVSMDNRRTSGHNGGNDNGGNNMDNRFVTHKELENVELRLGNKIDLLTQKVDNRFDSLPDKIQIQINNAEKEQEAKHTATMHWIWGSLVFGILSTAGTITTIIISLTH